MITAQKAKDLQMEAKYDIFSLNVKVIESAKRGLNSITITEELEPELVVYLIDLGYGVDLQTQPSIKTTISWS